jgi:hypothetical protein
MFQLRRFTESLSPTLTHYWEIRVRQVRQVMILMSWLAETTTNNDHLNVNRFGQKQAEMQGARVLILTGEYKGQQGVCLGEADRVGLWAISPDGSDEIVCLAFEKDFGLLVDLSLNPQFN